MFRLFSTFKGIGLVAVPVLVLFCLWRSYMNLCREKEVLEFISKDQVKAIEIQQKVINVVKNNKSVDFDSNMQRMWDGKL